MIERDRQALAEAMGELGKARDALSQAITRGDGHLAFVDWREKALEAIWSAISAANVLRRAVEASAGQKIGVTESIPGGKSSDELR